MDIQTRRAIHHLLAVWQQYSSSVAADGSVYYEHQHMSAGEGAANFVARLGLGTDDGIGLVLNEQGRAIADDSSLAEG